MTAPAPALAPVPAPAYHAEVRFGVVMYGGVSLAVYINGVSSELFELACATPREGEQANHIPGSATREVYRRLSLLAANAELRQGYAEQIGQRDPAEPAKDMWQPAPDVPEKRTRFVIDVIAGASAGGINGIYLGKALVRGQPFGSLQQLWIKEGDIGLLLNDKRSYEGLGLPPGAAQEAPKSLLNSDRMYLKLLDALQRMEPTRPAPPGNQSPLVEDLDLYLTTTDIRGTPVPLRLFDRLVHERRHKQRFHFRYPTPEVRAPQHEGGDFDPPNMAFLAFAARCTSSFPFAFEPMTLAHVSELGSRESAAGLRRFDDLFDGLPREMVQQGRHLALPFGDGGYLDNKPFSYVAEALSHRFGDAPASRKLIYVEPDPEWLDDQHDAQRQLQPDALANVRDALFTIPFYETIREDLDAVLVRNRRIERVEGLVHQVEADIERGNGPNANPFSAVQLDKDGKLPPWRTLPREAMVRYYGPAVLPYRKLRVYATTDRLATQLAEAWQLPTDDDRFHALRALVRRWRDALFDDRPDGTQKQAYNEFLYCFDFDYRVRRVGFLMRRIDRLLRLPPGTPAQDAADPDRLDQTLALARKRHWRAEFDADAKDKADLALRQLKRLLRRGFRDMLHWRQSPPTLRNAAPEDRPKLLGLLDDLIGDAPLAGNTARQAAGLDPRRATQMERILARLEALANAGRADLAECMSEVEAAMNRLRFEDALVTVAPPRPPATAQATEARRLTQDVWRLLGQPRLEVPPSKTTAGAAGDGPLQAHLKIADSSGRAAATELQPLNTPQGECMRRMLGESFLMFDQFDQTRFTMYYGTDTGEPALVDVVRISPVDAVALVQERAEMRADERKLAGTALAHFGAFLDERWRRNDVLWGRLDGAERLIDAVLPPIDADSRTVHDELVAMAQRHILRESLLMHGQDQLTHLLLEAMQGVPAPQAGRRLCELVSALNLGNPAQRERLAEVLIGLLDEQRLIEYVRRNRLVDSQPEPAATLDNAARAVAIIGKLLEGINHGRGSTSPISRWVARAGLVMQGLVAVSVPGSLVQLWFSRAMLTLYSFEVVLLVVALVLGTGDMRTAAIGALLATAAVHLVSLLVRDHLRGRSNWLGTLVPVAVAALLALAGLGAWGWLHAGPRLMLCGAGPAASSPSLLIQQLCKP